MALAPSPNACVDSPVVEIRIRIGRITNLSIRNGRLPSIIHALHSGYVPTHRHYAQIWIRRCAVWT